MTTDPAVNVAGIPGSLRRGSRTRLAVEAALAGAAEAGATTRIIDLADYHLPLVDGSDDYGPEVQRFCADVAWADGIILGTPEYHGGYSGVLKNALDHLGFNEFQGRVVGLVGVAGGALGASNALQTLRTVVRSLHAWVVPNEAAIPRADDAFDDSGRPRVPALQKRLAAVGAEVARFSYLHRSEAGQDFLRAWEQAQPNPGGA